MYAISTRYLVLHHCRRCPIRNLNRPLCACTNHESNEVLERDSGCSEILVTRTRVTIVWHVACMFAYARYLYHIIHASPESGSRATNTFRKIHVYNCVYEAKRHIPYQYSTSTAVMECLLIYQTLLRSFRHSLQVLQFSSSPVHAYPTVVPWYWSIIVVLQYESLLSQSRRCYS